jgi:hypothetical protein
LSLWTDGETITSVDLAALDSSIPKVASAENIVLEGPGSVIRQAWTETGGYLRELMLSFDGSFGNYQQGQIAALFSGQRVRFLLNQVIVGGWDGLMTPLETYTARHAAVLFWTQAERRSDKDRYTAKRVQAEADRREAKRTFWATGIPVVYLPISAPGAQFDPLSGVWNPASVLSVGTTGGAFSADVLLNVAITWIDGTVYKGPLNILQGESGPSRIVSQNFAAGSSALVSIANLKPPGTIPYQGGVAGGSYFSRNASGWNVYAGLQGQPLTLQNVSAPLPLTTTHYEITTLGVGPALLPGQAPESYQRPSRTFSLG